MVKHFVLPHLIHSSEEPEEVGIVVIIPIL